MIDKNQSSDTEVHEQDQYKSLFNATLNPVTARYVQSKYKLLNSTSNTEDLAKIDLRHMCQDVVQELESIEKSAAYDYLKVETEMVQLNEEINRSDDILKELEDVLVNFRDHLNEIKSEMTSLQEKSLKMNTSLTNRKHLQKLLGTFMDSAVLDPKLIDAINEKPVDENYVENIKILCQKLEYLKNTQLSDATAIKELEPELNRLKNKACGRVREFLLEKIALLKKPMTNIPIMQKNYLIKFRVFIEFLKEHYIEIYVELCKTYAEVMSKIYLNKFKSYVKEVEKLQIELYTKHDTLLNENPSNIRSNLAIKGNMQLSQEGKSIFYLMNRDDILKNVDQDPISFQIATQKNQRFLIESIFKSINKFLLEVVASEVVFTNEFFNLNMKQNDMIFGGIFKQTFNFLYDFFKTQFDVSYDTNGILIVILINHLNKNFYSAKIYNVLDFYFNQINIIVWPRFEQLFEQHFLSIKKMQTQVFKQVERNLGWKLILNRYIDFALSMYRLYSFLDDSMMSISSRLNQIKDVYHDLIARSSTENPVEIDRIIYLLRIYDQITTSYNQCQMVNHKIEFQRDTEELEKKINTNIDKLTQIYLNNLFGELIKFVKKYCKMEGPEEFIEEKMVVESGKNLGDNTILVDNICKDITSFWNKKTESFKLEQEKLFQGFDVLKKILKKFLNVLMAYYGTFYKYLKTNFPDKANNMIKVHEMMKEIQKSYNI